MVNTFIRWFEAKTQIYLYPRFVITVGLLLLAILIFSIAYFFSHRYTERVQSVGPQGEKAKAEYDAFMRSGASKNKESNIVQ